MSEHCITLIRGRDKLVNMDHVVSINENTGTDGKTYYNLKMVNGETLSVDGEEAMLLEQKLNKWTINKITKASTPKAFADFAELNRR